MAAGDARDIAGRIKALLPGGWFRDETPLLDAVLDGIAAPLASTYSLIAYARQQTRIITATDGFLDLIALDFFGATLARRPGESDDAFRLRIRAALLPERGTRRGLVRALELLTGRTPLVFEPARPADTGGYNANSAGYGVAGAYGSLRLPFQAFVTAYRPAGQGIPNIGGYGDPPGAYNTPSRAMYGNMALVQGAVTDADILEIIDAVKPAGVIIWTRIES